MLRLALAFSFLSAVADRFGLWSQFGTAGVAWGDFERFTAYTARLLWFLPPSLVVPAAILATGDLHGVEALIKYADFSSVGRADPADNSPRGDCA